MKTKKSTTLIIQLLVFLATSPLTLAQEANTTFDAEEGITNGFPISSADNATLIGVNAGDKLSSGLSVTLIGSNAGANINNDSDNTFVGAFAGNLMTTGIDNVMIGARAGFNNSGSDVTFVGNQAGYSNTTGADNTFIGEDAGYRNTVGQDNVFIGEDAGYSNVGGDSFSSPFPFPFNFLRSAIGDANVFVGSTAGRQNVNGASNVAIGDEAGFDLGGSNAAPAEESSFNTYVGAEAGIDGGAVRANTMVGWVAGWHNENGDNNTFLGAGAGYDNNRLNDAEGNNNTYVGTFAGARLRRGNNNVFVGHNSGGFGNSTNDLLNNSILIGNNAEFLNSQTTNYDYGVGIGADVDVECSNCMVLGGNTPATRVSVGIGTSSPNPMATLELAETNSGFLINRLTNAQRATLGGSLIATDEGMMVYDSSDDIIYAWNGSQWVSGTGATGPQGPAGNDGAVGAVGPIGPQGLAGNDGAIGAVGPVGLPGPAGPMGPTGTSSWTDGPGQVTTSVNVGIGATTPEQPLHIMRSGNVRARIETTSTTESAELELVHSDGGTGNEWHIYTRGLDKYLHFWNEGDKVVFTDFGNVGIGSSNPNKKASLELAGLDRGLLINRMTSAERATFGTLLVAPDEGMMVYDTEDDAIYTWDGSLWANGSVGDTGPQGPAGNDGALGAVGPIGPQGLAGNDGALGAVGPIGPIGPQGPAGNDGAVGAVGPIGPQGPTGATVHTLQAGAQNLRRNQSSVTVSHGHNDANAGVVALRNGIIVGFSVAVDTNITRGTATVNVTINSTSQSEPGQSIILNSGTDSGFVEFPTPINFSAGDRLSFSISTSNFRPGSADATLAMWARW